MREIEKGATYFYQSNMVLDVQAPKQKLKKPPKLKTCVHTYKAHKNGANVC